MVQTKQLTELREQLCDLEKSLEGKKRGTPQEAFRFGTVVASIGDAILCLENVEHL